MIHVTGFLNRLTPAQEAYYHQHGEQMLSDAWHGRAPRTKIN